MKLLILLTAILITSCSTVKRYSYEAVNLQEGEISKTHLQCNLVKVHPSARGYKHTFVSVKNEGDTLTRFYAKPMEVNKCYWVWRMRTEKNL